MRTDGFGWKRPGLCGKPCVNFDHENCAHDAAHPNYWCSRRCRDAKKHVTRAKTAAALKPPGET